MIGQFADIHSHILPGVDDGAKDMDKAMQMLDIAYRDGTRLLFLTPHYMRHRYDVAFSKIEEQFSQLQAKAAEKYPDLQLELGREIYMEQGILEDVRNGKCGTMAGTRHVLAEFSPGVSWKECYQGLRELANSGYQVILAHVERYGCLQKKDNRIQELDEAGILLQMNASAIVRSGLFSKSPSRVSSWNRSLVMDGKITFLGSDAHDTKDRAPQLRKCAEWIDSRLSKKEADALLYHNARDIILAARERM